MTVVKRLGLVIIFIFLSLHMIFAYDLVTLFYSPEAFLMVLQIVFIVILPKAFGISEDR